MECPHCQLDNPNWSLFCGHCGRRTVAYLGDPFGNGPAPSKTMSLAPAAAAAALAAPVLGTVPALPVLAETEPPEQAAATAQADAAAATPRIGPGTLFVWALVFGGVMFVWQWQVSPVRTVLYAAAYLWFATRFPRVGCMFHGIVMITGIFIMAALPNWFPH